ncbi:putative receptor-like protein kinase At4g00960 isoform X1 [Papaver somniferum]|nr:putative receptor-like protein kinase At4g00960 isoform X1 [Papaver somniferum]
MKTEKNMKLRMRYCLLIILIINYYSVCIFAEPVFLREYCSGGNYTANSTYQSNLNLLLSSSLTVFRSVVSIVNEHRSASYGSEPDSAYGSYQCRSDLTSKDCEGCFDSVTGDILNSIRCPNSRQGIVWYEECILRYSNESFIPVVQEKPVFYIVNETKVTSNRDEFNKTLAGLMDELVRESTASEDSHQFATGEANLTESRKIYGLVQCTPDILSSDCRNCLNRVVRNLSVCCLGKVGARVLNPTCNFRYELHPFYESKVMNATAPQSSLPTSTNAKRKNSSGKFAIIMAVLSVIAVLCIIAIWCLCSRKASRKTKKFDKIYEIQSAESVQFNFDSIKAATDNFSTANKLGEGGFGPVYKGTLSDAQEIAVKRLSKNSGQGEVEFKNEVVLLVKLQHRNLVKLLGFCLDGQERLLVYNFMPNSSLDRLIFGPVPRTHLDWKKRYKIIGGIARGLLYLHEDSRLKIIHRDLKASNVLLDADMNPKIADFGMARLFKVDQTQASTNRIVGTYGYMAPEYAMHGKFSDKTDVFSFGVLVLEIIIGKKINDPAISGDLLSYTWRHWNNGTALEMLSSNLKDNHSESEVMRCIHIGLLCVQENAADRPTMAKIVLMLNNYSTNLPVPSVPALFSHSFKNHDFTWGANTDPSSVNEASITELFPR